MKKDIDIGNLLDADGYLNDAGVLLYVDALKLKRQNDLPEAILKHVSECSESRERVFAYYDFTADEPVTQPHPYFDESPAKTVSINWIPLAAAAAVTILVALSLLFFVDGDDDNGRGNNPIVTADSTDLKTNKADSALLQVELEKDTTSGTNFPEDTIKEVENGTIKSNQPKRQPKVDTPPLIAYQRVKSLDRQIDRNNVSRGLKVEKPAIDATFDATFKNEVLFQWSAPAKSPLLLEIFTAATVKEPISIEIPKGESGYTYREALPANLYYWKVFEKNGNRKKQIGLGRFTISN